MPKNYQITQYDKPSTLNGYVDFEFQGGISRVRITRAHLEEDVGKNFHFERQSGVDFNRAGVPLMEIVSEPDLSSADMAYEYLNALKDILVYGGVSDCDMEKGMVRCDVNVSVRPKGQTELGAKIEIKNMNSFSGVRKALEYEIPRQIEVLRSGGKLIQSTRRWDDVAGITEEMRTKEYAHDYRYFPEPDLMPFQPTESWLEAVSRRVVELPLTRKRRFMGDYQLTKDQADAFNDDRDAGAYFEECAREILAKNMSPEEKRRELRATANTIIQRWRPKVQSEGLTWSGFPVSTTGTVAASGSFARGEMNSSAYQVVTDTMILRAQSDYRIVLNDLGLAQVSDTGALEQFADQVIASNPGPVADFKAGKSAALNFLKGQVMKLSKGKANPTLVGEILERKLKA
jgi:aspartyl-tRNA(Asn)/glutamyl-tRNA(Gln) amidotransferase subunit B